MASLGFQASFRLVNAESGACRAFRVPQREGPAGGAALHCRAAGFQSSAAAHGAIAAPASPEERVPVVLPARDGSPGRSCGTSADDLATVPDVPGGSSTETAS